MDIANRNESVTELRANNKRLTVALAAVSLGLLLVAGKLFFQSEIVLLNTPGMPSQAVIQKQSFDKASQAATLTAVTTNLASITPANAEYQKRFLQMYFAPEAYTKINQEIDFLVEKMKVERENGSRYFISKRYEYDPALDKHFVIGELHVVNAAKDTYEDHVFEYQIKVENYRVWIVEAKSYKGATAHNSEWVKANSNK